MNPLHLVVMQQMLLLLTLRATQSQASYHFNFQIGQTGRLELRILLIRSQRPAILLLIYGGFKLIEEIVTDPEIGILLKGGLLLLIVGLAILFISILRERLFIQKKDRYKDVRR